ncbi:hypothetical protein DMUE_1286 [Dictyocoela muelleri]|nr:hypothetical protein DMUE_1286 [Dictyocoela muelleri]
MFLDRKYLNYNEHNSNAEDILETIENKTQMLQGKKTATNKYVIECFFGLLQRDVTLIDMSSILNLSYKTVKRLYKRYLNGEFQDLSNLSLQRKIRGLPRKIYHLKGK